MGSPAWLIVLAVVVPVLVLALSYYILVYFQHPEDRSHTITPKVVVVFGLFVVMITVLTVPFDVANLGEMFGCGSLTTSCGGLGGIQWVWLIEFLIIGLLVVFFIPWTLFYYESFDYENDTTAKACWDASWSLFATTFLGVAIFLLCYFFLRTTYPPVESFQVTALSLSCPTPDCTALTPPPSGFEAPASSTAFVTNDVPFLVFVPGFLSFLGWFLFSLYAGIGLIALPFDMIRSFVHRPKYMPRDAYTMLKKETQIMTKEYIEIGERMLKEQKELDKNPSSISITSLSRRREERRLFNEFKKSVIELEESYNDLKTCHENWKFYNPFVPWFKLCVGIVGGVISLLWLLQIVLFNLVRSPDGFPTIYFLNVMFSAASRKISFAFIGTILIGIFTFYLLLAMMKGNEKFGLRFFIVELHPMKFGGTYMNSFLVNTSLLLICTPALISFVSSSLANYIAMTDLDAIFGQQITYLMFFNYFFQYDVFTIILLASAGLTLIFMIACPDRKTAGAANRMIKRLEELEEKQKREERAAKREARTQNAAATNEEGQQPPTEAANTEASSTEIAQI